MQEQACSLSTRSPSLSSSTSGDFSFSSFEIPTHWWPETDSCIKKKDLTPECRSDIVRTLVTLMITKVGPKPSKSQCEQVARKLILKYPFMKDDIGFGYVSLNYLYYSVMCICLIMHYSVAFIKPILIFKFSTDILGR